MTCYHRARHTFFRQIPIDETNNLLTMEWKDLRQILFIKHDDVCNDMILNKKLYNKEFLLFLETGNENFTISFCLFLNHFLIEFRKSLSYLCPSRLSLTSSSLSEKSTTIIISISATIIVMATISITMFEWVLNTPLIPFKLLSLSTICEEAYLEPSQTFGMDVSARVVGLSL